MLPTVDFCGLKMTRLLIGSNPFGGYSHQNEARDREMLTFNTKEEVVETWRRAEKAGLNTMTTNNETPHVVAAVKEYLASGGKLQWIAQVNAEQVEMLSAVDEVVAMGCKALFFHGGQIDDLFSRQDDKTLGAWVAHAKSAGIPIGVAAHSPAAHYWVDSLGIVDFHMVCFFDCGSVHAGAGERFNYEDPVAAVACIKELAKPCIAYKIMGAGRIDPEMAFNYAFANIKPGDVVNVGMNRGDNDKMVEENAALVAKVLAASD